MKPNADMITKILHNLRVNGRFNQDKLIIGRGQDEQLQLMISDTVGIRYTPGVTGERTFSLQITTPDTHPVWGTAVTLYPHPKPSNSYTNRTVLASSTMVWISEPLPDFPTTVFAMMVTTDNTENVAPAMAQRWSLRSLDYNETNQDVDWENSSETILVCGNDTITWSGDEASMYPSSPNDWNTTGSVGSQPVAFNMSATEGSAAKLEYTNDGSTWYEFGGTSSVGLTYEPIEFDQSHLSSDGKITIQHNFNDKNVLCLGYTPQPKEIEYLDNQIVLDYSDQNSSNFTGAVWFVNSTQSMLTEGSGIDPEPDQSQFSMVFCDTPIGSSTTYAELSLKPGTIFRLEKDVSSTDLNSRKWVGETNRSSGTTYTIVHRDDDDRWMFNATADGVTRVGIVVATTSGHTNPWDVPKWEYYPGEGYDTFYGQLFQPIDLSKPVFRITDAGDPLLIGDYVEVPTSVWNQYVSTSFTPDRTITHVYTNVEYGDYVVEGNSVEPYIYYTTLSPGNPCTQPYYKGKVFTNSNDPLSVTTWEIVDCISPLPTLVAI